MTVCTLAVESPLGPGAFEVRRLSASEQLGRPFHVELDLLSEREDLAFEDLLGEEVVAHIERDGEPVRSFHGHVTGFWQIGRESGFAVYRAVVSPWLWFLTRVADCRIFQEMSVPDIVMQVFRDNGFSDFEDRLSETYQPWEFCVQYRETCFNFVSRLLEQEGIYYYFVHDPAGRHTLVLADGPTAHQTRPEGGVIPFFPPGEEAHRPDDHVNSWVLRKVVQPGAYAHSDFDFKVPRKSLLTTATDAARHARDDFEIFDYPGEYRAFDEGERYARVRLDELRGRYEQISATGTMVRFAYGQTFELSDPTHTLRDDQEREYLVTGTDFRMTQSPPGAGERGDEGSFRLDFSVIESSQTFRPARTTPKPVVQGPQTAIVVGPAGEEIHTDEHGRVKLHFHWDRHDKSDENSSCWIRVSHAWAGQGWGAIYLPRIGQEVIVEFLEGDPDHPIITGRVYNGVETPPYGLPDEKTKSTLKSRSSKGGGADNFNEIRFEDKIGSEELYIQAEKDENILVKNDKSEQVGHDESRTIGNDRTDDVGHDETRTVGNDRTDTVGNNETRTVHNDRQRTVNNNESITVTKMRTHTVGINEAITVGAAQEVTIGAAQTIAVGAAQETIVGMAQSTTVGANRTVTVKKNMTEKIGKKLVIDAGDEITIKTGKASITMKSSGDITISGKKITVKGSGNVIIKGKKVLEN